MATSRPVYVPILRTKPAEWEALRTLPQDLRQLMVPCLEVLPAELDLVGLVTDEGLRPAINECARKIGRTWGMAPIFVDLSHLGPSLRSERGEHPVALLGQAAKAYRIRPIVTANLYADHDYLAALRDAVRARATRVALRLHYADLGKDDCVEGIESLLGALDVVPAETDFFVECGVVDDNSPDYDWLCSRVPALMDWRRFVVSGGSFPRTLEGMGVGSRIRARYEWQHWQTWAFAPKPLRARIPNFSDYTIQHAVFYEPPKRSNPSASIRYAAETYWAIMRGEAIRGEHSLGNQQYYGNAQLLCERQDFMGAQYSPGDRYIWEVANRIIGPGTPTTWITAGMVHHMVLAARQVSATLG